MAQEKLLREVIAKLDVITRLLACNIIYRFKSDKKQQKDLIEALATGGLPNPTIAALIGASTATVRNAVNRARKKKDGAARAER